MIIIKYQWHSMVTKQKNLGRTYEVLSELELPLNLEDENFFTSREDAINWLEKMKESDELFADGDCLILTEMFFT